VKFYTEPHNLALAQLDIDSDSFGIVMLLLAYGEQMVSALSAFSARQPARETHDINDDRCHQMGQMHYGIVPAAFGTV
jgi:hypothetical protein